MSDEYENTNDDGFSSDDVSSGGDTSSVDTANGVASSEQKPDDAQLVRRIQETIRRDKKHFEKAFKRMNRSMFIALQGRAPEYPESHYKANITGQHIRTKTAALYAKNPRIVARRKESLDFIVWDETPESLQMAMQTVAAGTAAIAATNRANEALAAQNQGVFAPAMGHNGGPSLEPLQPQLPPGYEQALAIVEDFQTGMALREALRKFGRTLELVFADAMRQQTPLDFKSSMKRLVRRSLTTGVGYVELGFQQQFGIPEATTNALADYRQRIAHLESLMADAADPEKTDCEAEVAELEKAIAALEAQPQLILRKGLTFDFLQATKVIPDRLTTALAGFLGGNHLTLEYVLPKKDVEETFKVKLGTNYTPYTVDGQREYGSRGVDYGDDSTDGVFAAQGKDDDLVCLFKHYDKRSGLVYHVVDGYPKFLKEPSAPPVTVPRFWPVYPITLNDTESEKEVFPRSDVENLEDVQNELNRSRQGKREHRQAARPRWVYAAGALDEEVDVPNLEQGKPFEVIKLNGVDPSQDIGKVLQAVPVPGVDPNLYDTNEVMQDAALSVGAQAAQLGGLTKSTATQAAIADGSNSVVDSSGTDDLDSFLTMMSRDGGQILMENMSKDDVIKIAGRGAVWVEDLGMTLEQIYNEVFLEVEAGSTGRPNQAQEIRNIKEIGPLLLQVGAIPPTWLAKEFLRRFDDRMDLTEAVVAGVPAIVAQNRMAQPAQGDPQKDPQQQGGEGGDKNASPSGPSGSSAPGGNNQSPSV